MSDKHISREGLGAGPTPGPWVTDPRFPGNVYSDDSVGSIIFSAGPFNLCAVQRSRAEKEANARLAVSAKDLLAALIEYVEEDEAALQRYNATSTGKALPRNASVRLTAARAAISKATVPSTGGEA